MKISIALATYNGERFLLGQLESLYTQTRTPDEVIICDDGSSDRTGKIAEDFIRARRLENRWRFAVNPTRLGSRGNFKACVAQTTGDLIFLCDQDDLWMDTKIETVAGLFAQHPPIQVLNHSFEFMDEDGRPLARTHPSNTANNGLIPFAVPAGAMVRIPFPTIVNKNISMGCTMAFTAAIRKRYVERSQAVLSHDYELNLYGGAVDGLFFHNVPLIRYRLHRDNACGLYVLQKPYPSLALQKIDTWPAYVRGQRNLCEALSAGDLYREDRRDERRYAAAFRRFVEARCLTVERRSLWRWLTELALYARGLRGSLDPRGLVIDAMYVARLDRGLRWWHQYDRCKNGQD